MAIDAISHSFGEKANTELSCVLLVVRGILLASCFLLATHNGAVAQATETELYVKKYEDYLHSLGNISYDFRTVYPSTGYGGTIKHNGMYCYRRVFDENNPYFNYESVCSKEEYKEIAFEEDGELIVYGYLDNSNIRNFNMDSYLGVPELSGYTSFRPPFETRYIPDLMRSFRLTASLDSRDGTDLVVLSGVRGRVSIRAWFDPAQSYLLKFLELKQENASDGEMIVKTVSFSKFIDVNGVKVPTFYEYFHSMVFLRSPNRIDESKITIVIDNITIADNSNPTPYSFQTKIPNGTRAVLMDAQQIEHIWYDGKVVPKTNELMMRIAMGDHKFMPGPDQPRFWLMASAILLITLGLGKMLYNIFYKKEEVKF